jgi:hypothetical protein
MPYFLKFPKLGQIKNKHIKAETQDKTLAIGYPVKNDIRMTSLFALLTYHWACSFL